MLMLSSVCFGNFSAVLIAFLLLCISPVFSFFICRISAIALCERVSDERAEPSNDSMIGYQIRLVRSCCFVFLGLVSFLDYFLLLFGLTCARAFHVM